MGMKKSTFTYYSTKLYNYLKAEFDKVKSYLDTNALNIQRAEESIEENEQNISKNTDDIRTVSNKVDNIQEKLDDYAQKTDLEGILTIDSLIAGDNVEITKDTDTNTITINATGSGTGADGTSDFEMLSNKPKINGITVMGEKTSKDLGLLDISYASEENEGSVKLADKAKTIDMTGELDGTAKYYGVASGGTNADNTFKLRPFPVGLATERIETLDFEILTKDIPQSIPFAREIPTVNCFVQAFKQEDSELNVTDIFEDYNNELVSNHSENVTYDFVDGLSINDTYKYAMTLNSDGLYETDIINKDDFIEIARLEMK